MKHVTFVRDSYYQSEHHRQVVYLCLVVVWLWNHTEPLLGSMWGVGCSNASKHKDILSLVSIWTDQLYFIAGCGGQKSLIKLHHNFVPLISHLHKYCSLSRNSQSLPVQRRWNVCNRHCSLINNSIQLIQRTFHIYHFFHSYSWDR